MEKQNFYKYTTWALILVNVAMVTFFLITSRNPPPPRNDVANNARALMEMDNAQEAQFLKLANAHKKEMRDINDEQRTALMTYFATRTEVQNDSTNNEHMNSILKFEKQKIESTYQHFEDIKSILNADQYAGFEQFKNKALQFILLNQKKDSPPPKD